MLSKFRKYESKLISFLKLIDKEYRRMFTSYRLNWSMAWASEKGYARLVPYFIHAIHKNYNNPDLITAFHHGIEGRKLIIMKYLYSQCCHQQKSQLKDYIQYAARTGDASLIDFFINLGVRNWQDALYGAIEGCQPKYVDRFSNKIFHAYLYWERLLGPAVHSQHPFLILYFILKIGTITEKHIKEAVRYAKLASYHNFDYEKLLCSLLLTNTRLTTL